MLENTSLFPFFCSSLRVSGAAISNKTATLFDPPTQTAFETWSEVFGRSPKRFQPKSLI